MSKLAAQSFKNGEVHDWYRIVLGYSDHLVEAIITKFGIKPKQSVLDPFCGSGTTAVECLKKGIHCWGIDVNPSSCFAARVKTSWGISRRGLVPAAKKIVAEAKILRVETFKLKKDRTFQYLKSSGMLDRRWIGFKKLYDIIALKQAINASKFSDATKDLFLLATVNVMVHEASNVRFGPELYCSRPRSKVNVNESFLKNIGTIEQDLKKTEACPPAKANIKSLDSRYLTRRQVKPPRKGFNAVICSPPYPTEHDYTRNARLELALLEAVFDKESLRKIKKRMIRSHTKGIYSSDNDSSSVEDRQGLNRLAERIDRIGETKSYGFARLYGRVLKEYFGGMKLHFSSVFPLLANGANCAYVVGDQSSYFQVPVKTATHLSEIAESVGFEVVGIQRWRRRWATASGKFVQERILLLRKP